MWVRGGLLGGFIPFKYPFQYPPYAHLQVDHNGFENRRLTLSLSTECVGRKDRDPTFLWALRGLKSAYYDHR